MNLTNMTNWTIDAVKEALAAKKISARELAAEYYSRIAARNPELNAFLTLSEERAYAQADRIDALVSAAKPLPPLAGVPIAIKDVLSTHRRRTSGSRRRSPPRQDQLRRIRHGQLQ